MTHMRGETDGWIGSDWIVLPLCIPSLYCARLELNTISGVLTNAIRRWVNMRLVYVDVFSYNVILFIRPPLSTSV